MSSELCTNYNESQYSEPETKSLLVEGGVRAGVTCISLIKRFRGIEVDEQLALWAQLQTSAYLFEGGVFLPEFLPLVLAEHGAVLALRNQHFEDVLAMHLHDLKAAVSSIADDRIVRFVKEYLGLLWVVGQLVPQRIVVLPDELLVKVEVVDSARHKFTLHVRESSYSLLQLLVELLPLGFFSRLVDAGLAVEVSKRVFLLWMGTIC